MKIFLKTILFLPILFSSFLYATSDQQEKIKTVTDFYTRYLNQEYEQGWPSIFSSRLKKALDENIEDCRKYVRNGNICGYTADGDILLNAQDYSETLTFSNSNFSAIAKPDNLISVSFILFPEYPEDAGDRELSFNMAKENNQWKIDDIESSAYVSMDAEKAALIEYNQSLENALNDLQITFELTDNKQFELFLNDQTKICIAKSCKVINPESISGIFQKIFDKYYRKTGEYTVEPKQPLYPQPVRKFPTPKEGDTADVGIFSWVYKNNLWIITEINL